MSLPKNDGLTCEELKKLISYDADTCGFFDNLEEASLVALEQAKVLQGAFARLS